MNSNNSLKSVFLFILPVGGNRNVAKRAEYVVNRAEMDFYPILADDRGRVVAPGRDRRAAASPGAERSVRRRKTNRKASVFFPFVPPCRAGASQRDALYLLEWWNLMLKPVPE